MTLLSEVKERAELARKGPWRWERVYEMPDGSKHWSLVNPNVPGRVVDGSLVLISDFDKGGDGILLSERPEFKFLAHAREDIPYLLKLIEAKDMALAEMIGTHGEPCNPYTPECRALVNAKAARALGHAVTGGEDQ
jgi:hypothetical protein